MKFRITGADCENGDVVEVTITAPNADAAREQARELGVLAQSVEDADQPQTSETAQPIVVISPSEAEAEVRTAVFAQPNARWLLPHAPHSGGHPHGHSLRPAGSLGLAAIVLGMLALLVCWLPFIALLSLPLSVLGVMAAAVGVMLGLRRRGSSTALPLAGAAVSALAAVVAIVSGVGSLSALSGAAQHVETTADIANHTPTTVAVGDTAKVGGIALTLDSVEIGPLALRSTYNSAPIMTDASFLIVRITITNASATKRLGPIFASGTVSDGHNNNYKEISPYNRFGASSRIDGLPFSADAVYPGDTVKQWIIFDRPVDPASPLHLSLSILERTSALQTNQLAHVRWRLPGPSAR